MASLSAELAQRPRLRYLTADIEPPAREPCVSEQTGLVPAPTMYATEGGQALWMAGALRAPRTLCCRARAVFQVSGTGGAALTIGWVASAIG